MILHTAQLAAHHILALAPGDPTPMPYPYPTVQPGDPTLPHQINMAKAIGFFLIFVLTPTLIIAGYKILTKGGVNGKVKESFQHVMGLALGLGVIVLAITGLGYGIALFASSWF